MRVGGRGSGRSGGDRPRRGTSPGRARSACRKPDATPLWSLDFWVEDADASAGRVVELGGKAVVPPYDAPGFREAVLADPQGASFSVSKLTAGA
jgi:predicted enzyme related to lactoylglutathione lyase